jgi:DnaK suppressor protein
MSTHFSPEQKARLGAALREREQVLRTRLAAQYGNTSRVEHAREILLQDGDDATQRDADREVDLAMSDRDTVELTRIEQALSRLAQGSYGECIDCGEPVPFGRLELEPQALRCVACEAVLERTQPRTASM